MNDLFSYDITTIKGIGDARARLFRRLGAGTVGALLRLYPRVYENWDKYTTLAEADTTQPTFIKATVTENVAASRISGGKTLYKSKAVDENGAVLRLVFFNNPYISKMLVKDREYVFYGKVNFDYGAPTLSSPTFRPVGECSQPRAVYPQTEGLASNIIARTVRSVLEKLPVDMPDPIPQKIRIRYALCDLRTALFGIHAPETEADIKSARRRLAFEELFMLQLGLMRMKGRARGENSARLSADFSEEFYALLPFQPTGAQRRAVSDAIRDMMHGKQPMARLVQGDVGSGKTVVAVALCHSCARCGMQSALMAPTEILAEQHYNTFCNMLGSAGIKVALLTGSLTAAQKRRTKQAIADGEIDVVVGTHALISEDVVYSRLGLVITDEQHRFGVSQRAALSDKGMNPHMLVMSATPIPRTLALMIFGDLDVSVLDEMPKGRIPVKTYWIDSGKRERAYNFIKKHLDEGRQAFIVCPLVSEGESDLASAEEYQTKLATGYFKNYGVGLLHGKMKAQDKEYVMRKFVGGELDVLVSTTVVEVGVDVPNAVIMLIENAERFGLSQLHQLRGRVGRGSEQAHCILISDVRSEHTAHRLHTMTQTSDGFEISSEDLKLRGPGDFFGSRQHGLPNLRVADFASDMAMLTTAQSEAKAIIDLDPQLSLPEHELLRQGVEQMFSETSFS